MMQNDSKIFVFVSFILLICSTKKVRMNTDNLILTILPVPGTINHKGFESHLSPSGFLFSGPA